MIRLIILLLGPQALHGQRRALLLFGGMDGRSMLALWTVRWVTSLCGAVFCFLSSSVDAGDAA